MYIQLGSLVFDKAFTPDSLSHSDETSYAEHALINIKPRLQPTGNNLEEIELGILLRAEITNITQTLLSLKNSKDTFEVLPLVYGTGLYKGDFVITKIEHSILSALGDGFPVAASVTISLKEFAIPDKLAQQQNTARKQAFAVGDITPTRLAPIAKYSPSQIASKDLSLSVSHSVKTDGLVRSYENNVSSQQSIGEKIQSSLASIDTLLLDAAFRIDEMQNAADFTELVDAISRVQDTLSDFEFPITSVADLKFANTNLQYFMGLLKQQSTLLNNLVITRRA
jgi:phage protein U